MEKLFLRLNLGGENLLGRHKLKMENKMNKKAVGSWLGLAVLFLIIAFVAGLFGFGFISGFSFLIAKWFAIIFVILFIISVIAHTIKSA
jgi:uncharacterized membrane protein YtjA (UPF0391 family)